MADLIQCDNCGAVLAKEDLFCGECGVPRPVPPETGPASDEAPAPAGTAESAEPLPGAPPEDDHEPLPPPRSPGSPEAGWRVAFFVLLGLGIMVCLAGVLAFVLVGSIGGDTTTVQEDWLISSLCCLLPVGGTGAILVAGGAVIWYMRLRSR